jgi:DNA polymerase-4
MGAQFVAGLPVRRFHGIGPRAAEKMAGLGIETGADLAARDLDFLKAHFGSQAEYLYCAARGIDLRQVKSNRPRKSVGTERTFDHDISSGPALRETLERIIEIAWNSIASTKSRGRTVTLKLRLSDFTTLSRSRSLPHFVMDRDEFASIGRGLLEEVLPLKLPARLMGLTLSSLEGEAMAPVTAEPAQLSLL